MSTQDELEPGDRVYSFEPDGAVLLGTIIVKVHQRYDRYVVQWDGWPSASTEIIAQLELYDDPL